MLHDPSLLRHRGSRTGLVLALALSTLGAGDPVTVPKPGEFVEQQLGEAVSQVRILEVGKRAVFVYGRAATNDPTELGAFCRGAAEALEMVMPGRSAHVLWHTPLGIDHKCPAPENRRALPEPAAPGARGSD
ncbi:MAG: hypothetical protein V3R91_09530 [Myxococcota bacterium]